MRKKNTINLSYFSFSSGREFKAESYVLYRIIMDYHEDKFIHRGWHNVNCTCFKYKRRTVPVKNCTRGVKKSCCSRLESNLSPSLSFVVSFWCFKVILNKIIKSIVPSFDLFTKTTFLHVLLVDLNTFQRKLIEPNQRKN